MKPMNISKNKLNNSKDKLKINNKKWLFQPIPNATCIFIFTIW